MLEEGFKSLTDGVEFVKDFLDAADIEKGSYTYNLEPLDFKELVLEMAGKQKEIAEKKGLSFEVQISEGDYITKGDKAHFSQAIRNFIDNSIRYTPKGGLTINLSRAGDKILFVVKDTGVGLSDELKPRLFTKGGRAKDSLKVNVDSTGYGLSFVKGIVDAHKGRVWAESAGPGQGSTFYLELPVVV
jgi:signal transduction histidine kinase